MKADSKKRISRAAVLLAGGERTIRTHARQADDASGRSFFFRAGEDEIYILEVCGGEVKVTRRGGAGYTLMLAESRPRPFAVSVGGADGTAEAITRSLLITLDEAETHIEAEYILSFDDSPRRFTFHATRE